MSHQRSFESNGDVYEFEVGRVSEAVVDAIADAAGTDPLSIDPIYDAIDPDALEMLFRGTGSEVTLRFDHEGFSVEVDGHGTIRVGPESVR